MSPTQLPTDRSQAPAGEPGPAAAPASTSIDPHGPHGHRGGEPGLRSPQAIRWLLFTGALVTAVSAYRLIQARWASLPVPLQFLTLTTGTLAVLGLGLVTRLRLRLNIAGGAMLGLFAGLLPVLAWGAGSLRLLTSPAGWLAWGAGLTALSWAASRTARWGLGLHGPWLVAALGLFMAAPALCPALAALAAPGRFRTATMPLATALALGAALAGATRRVNRLFFHRDRLDQLERPVHLLPFLVFGALYLGTLLRLDPGCRFLGLALAAIGLALAGTGEEYYQALSQALGRAPERWPRRSVALLALGFAILAAAVPVAFLDPTEVCLALVCLLAAVRLLSWSLRYRSDGAHLAGLAAACQAWLLLDRLAPWATGTARGLLLTLTGIQRSSPALRAYGLLPFLAGLFVLGAALRRRQAGERLLRLHSLAAVLFLWLAAAFAVADSSANLAALGATVAVAAAGLLLSRRLELVVGLYFTAALAVVAVGEAVFGPLAASPGEVRPAIGCLLAACALAASAAGRSVAVRLARFTGTSLAEASRALALPALVVAPAVALASLSALAVHDPLGGVELLLAGGVLLAAGLELGVGACAVGAVTLSLGAHLAVAFAFGGGGLSGVATQSMDLPDIASLDGRLIGAAAPWLALLTQLCFLGTAALALGGRRRRAEGRISNSSAPSGPDSPAPGGEATAASPGPRGLELRSLCRDLATLHGFLGLAWLGLATLAGRVTVEPLILPLCGLFVAHRALLAGRRIQLLAGLLLLAGFLPCQLLAIHDLAWSIFLPLAVALAAPMVCALLVASRHGLPARLAERLGEDEAAAISLLAGTCAELAAAWRVLATLVCLCIAGPAALLLATATVIVALVDASSGPSRLDPVPALRLSLLLLIQAAVQLGELASSANRHLSPVFLPDAVAAAGAALLAPLAALAFIWAVAVVRLGGRERGERLAWWTHVIEALVAAGYLTAWSAGPRLSPIESLVLAGVACGWLALHLQAFVAARTTPRGNFIRPGLRWEAWAMHAWALLCVLECHAAGWLPVLRGTATPFALLAAGIAEYALGTWLERRGWHAELLSPCRALGLGLPCAAGLLGIARLWAGPAGPFAPLWLSAGAGFMASLFFFVVAGREERRTFPAAAAALLLGAALAGVCARTSLGNEFYFLAPGLALLALAFLLRTEMGPVWSRHVAAAGAASVYATPVVALSSELSWVWLAVLLLLAVAFGTASFVLRSRSLLTVSTAALVSDLAFFVLQIGSTAPLLLWAFGLAFGLALMVAGAWLEYQREGVLQQLRVFGRVLRSWS